MQERRQYKREILVLHLQVFNRDTGKILGYLADVSVSGLMMIGEKPVEVGKELPLGIQLERLENDALYVNSEENHIPCRAQSRWNSKLELDLYGIGFRFTNMSPTSARAQAIEKLIERASFHNNQTDCSQVDMMIHIDDIFNFAQLRQIEQKLQGVVGITTITFEEITPHLMIINYQPQQVNPVSILKHVTAEGIHAKLVRKYS